MDLLAQIILDVGSDEFYRATRYKTNLVVVLVNSDDKHAFDILERVTRQTDIVQQLNSALLVVYLPHTTEDEAIHFVDKIHNELDFTYTLNEYNGNDFEFIYKLLVENSKKASDLEL